MTGFRSDRSTALVAGWSYSNDAIWNGNAVLPARDALCHLLGLLPLETQANCDIYDPKVRQGPTEEQVPLTGPPDERLLQFPNTASSGRRLMRVSAGDSYAFFGSIVFPSIVQNTSANRNLFTSRTTELSEGYVLMNRPVRLHRTSRPLTARRS